MWPSSHAEGREQDRGQALVPWSSGLRAEPRDRILGVLRAGGIPPCTYCSDGNTEAKGSDLSKVP